MTRAMIYELQPGKLTGSVQVPVSKSHLHRLLIAEFLAQWGGEGLAGCPLGTSEDIQATLDCLATLQPLVNSSCANHPTSPSSLPVLNCRESGSTLRFLLPVVGALGLNAEFQGQGRLAARPLQPMLSVLGKHGCTFSAATLPLQSKGQLQSGNFELPGDISSQYISGLLLALPLLDGESCIELSSPLQSAGYVQMTLDVLRQYGIQVSENKANNAGWRVPGSQNYLTPPGNMPVPEPDYSSAAFWLAANALGAKIDLGELPPSSAQPDRAIRDILAGMQPNKSGHLEAIQFDASQSPDLVPIVAVVMSVANGRSRIVNAARLRLKESDRLAAMAQNLCALGADVREFADGLEIVGVSQLRGGRVLSFADHRIAMAMAIAATVCQELVLLDDPLVVAKSYPGFWEDYSKLSGKELTVSAAQCQSM